MSILIKAMRRTARLVLKYVWKLNCTANQVHSLILIPGATQISHVEFPLASIVHTDFFPCNHIFSKLFSYICTYLIAIPACHSTENLRTRKFRENTFFTAGLAGGGRGTGQTSVNTVDTSLTHNQSLQSSYKKRANNLRNSSEQANHL